MNEQMNIGNISTIATWISILLYPIVLKYGIDIDQAILTTFIYNLIVIMIAIWSSYNPNNFKFLKNFKEIPTVETVDEDQVADEDSC